MSKQGARLEEEIFTQSVKHVLGELNEERPEAPPTPEETAAQALEAQDFDNVTRIVRTAIEQGSPTPRLRAIGQMALACAALASNRPHEAVYPLQRALYFDPSFAEARRLFEDLQSQARTPNPKPAGLLARWFRRP